MEAMFSLGPRTTSILIGLAFTVPVVAALISRFIIRVVLEWRQ